MVGTMARARGGPQGRASPSFGVDVHWNTARPECATERTEAAGDGVTASGACAAGVEAVGADGIPVAFDDDLAAARAVGGAAVRVVDVAGVDVVQAGIEREAAGVGEGGGRRGRELVELVVGMEGGEVEGDVGAQFGRDPAGEPGDFGVGDVKKRSPKSSTPCVQAG